MKTKHVLLELRKKQGLSQDKMAERLFVTRQAVSRWENSETLPNVDTIKLISREFGVPIDDLLDSERNKICQSCTYPLNNPDEFGTNADGTWNTDYCIYCYKDGAWVDSTLTVQGVIEYTIPFMTSPSTTAEQSRAKLEKLVPSLKRWKSK